jgi:hypothetical protein
MDSFFSLTEQIMNLDNIVFGGLIHKTAKTCLDATISGIWWTGSVSLCSACNNTVFILSFILSFYLFDSFSSWVRGGTQRELYYMGELSWKGSGGVD